MKKNIIYKMYYKTYNKSNKLIFEWDEDKNTINIKKHSIPFKTAVRVFEDFNRIEIYDYKHSYTEDRFCTIGLVNEILVVVYTQRNNNIRIISARRANEKERREYYGQNS